MTDRKVKEVMATDVETLDRNQTLDVVRDIMQQKGVRHFPVLQDGALVGVVSQRDLLHATLGSLLHHGEVAERSFLSSIPVKEVVSEPAVTTSPEAGLREAARLMLEHRIGCLPVMEGGRLVGLLTETDLLRVVAEG